MSFVEKERGDLPCYCPCGRTWLISRGTIDHDGGVVSFVAVPTVHNDDRICWLAVGRGEHPEAWVFTRTWMDDSGDVAAAVVDGDGSPIHNAPMFAALGGAALSRDKVIGDDALKRHAFAVHDAVVAVHEDLRQLFDPERGRDFSFKMPDCVFALPAAERSPRNSDNFAERGERRFVRALLPVAIGDGGELRVGVWVEVPEDAFMALVEVFWDDEAAYVAMELRGPIESSLQLVGHDTRGARVTLAARTADKCLFVRSADDAWLAQVMTDGVSVRALPELIREIELGVGRVAN